MSKERERLLGENRAESLRTWRGQPADESELVLNKQASGDTGASAGGVDNMFYVMIDAAPGDPVGSGTLYLVNVATGEYREIGTPAWYSGRLTGLALDPVDNVLWSIQTASGSRVFSFTEEAVLIDGFGSTFYPVPDITIGADRIIRGWSTIYNQTAVISRINGAVTGVAYSGLSVENVGVANTEESGVCLVKSNNQLWSVNWASGEYTNVCGYVVEPKAGYSGPLMSPFGNWAGTTLLGARRSLDNGETTFYRLTLDGGITELASVPFPVYGLAWAPGRTI